MSINLDLINNTIWNFYVCILQGIKKMFWEREELSSNENEQGKGVFIFHLTDLEGWIHTGESILGKGYSLNKYLETDMATCSGNGE